MRLKTIDPAVGPFKSLANSLLAKSVISTKKGIGTLLDDVLRTPKLVGT